MSFSDQAILDNDEIARIVEVNRASHANQWVLLPCHPNTGLTPKAIKLAWRLNSLGSSFFFNKSTLRKHRLSNYFHRYYCSLYECEHLLEVFEIPRDHFKTTIGIGMAMWWALPFNDKDEFFMRKLGYGDEFINWMKIAHDQNTRTLIAMEVIKNAWKCGKKITGEYKENDLFKNLFPEIMPDSSCQWSQDTMTHKRNGKVGSNQGEGTYEFTGVDAALQSKHYRRMILDDLYGKEAMKSDLVAESTWEWVKLIVGAFDSLKNDPDNIPDVICNWNRWSFKDLSYRMRQANMGFRFHTHDAEGGCCDVHPIPQHPIFAEEFSMKKLARLKHWLGEYFYSCQFRNKPIPPGGNKFKLEWLKYFVFTTMPMSVNAPVSSYDIAREERQLIINAQANGNIFGEGYKIFPRDYKGRQSSERQYKAIRYNTQQGIVYKDVPTSHLIKTLFFDPNHAGEKGRARNCLLATGMMKSPLRIHILEGFAEICSREDAVQKLYEIGERWRIRICWIEGSAGQSWIPTLLSTINEQKRKDGKWYFDEFLTFRDNRNENAKDDRIEDTEPFFRRGEIFLNAQDPFTNLFKEEYEEYPHCRFKDILDTLGHALANIDINLMTSQDIDNFVSQQKHNHDTSSRSLITGY